MKFLIACGCIFILAESVSLLIIVIGMLDGTDFMNAIVERIRGKK